MLFGTLPASIRRALIRGQRHFPTALLRGTCTAPRSRPSPAACLRASNVRAGEFVLARREAAKPVQGRFHRTDLGHSDWMLASA